MHLHVITLTLELKTPFLVHGNAPGRFGMDAVQMKNRQGQRLLPGTLIAGRIADAWEEARKTPYELTELPEPRTWFATLPKHDASGTFSQQF
jgi:hypothetical protein